MTETTVATPSYTEFAAELHSRYAALVAAEPRLRIRDLASKLGVTEAALVAAQCGVQSQPLAGSAQTLLKQLGTLGRVLALSRNDACVHERHGRYEDIHAEGAVGMVLGPDIDLRLFFNCWQFAWHVTDPAHGRDSIQFFCR